VSDTVHIQQWDHPRQTQESTGLGLDVSIMKLTQNELSVNERASGVSGDV